MNWKCSPKNRTERRLCSVQPCGGEPHLWSAEDPALYELEIELLDNAGHLVEVTGQKIGFRKFELKNNRMLLNGKRIVFKGANRHEFSSITGRAVGVHTHEELLRDIITMKQNNINAIRTSHYQNQDALYDLCDEYGLYLIAENNLESHGTWDIHQAGIRGIEAFCPMISRSGKLSCLTA